MQNQSSPAAKATTQRMRWMLAAAILAPVVCQLAMHQLLALLAARFGTGSTPVLAGAAAVVAAAMVYRLVARLEAARTQLQD